MYKTTTLPPHTQCLQEYPNDHLITIQGHNPEIVDTSIKQALVFVPDIKSSGVQPALVITGTSVMYALEVCPDVSISL